MANAQVAHRGDPEAISGQPLPVAPCAVLPPVDVAPFLLEDARRRADEPVRFGIPIPANISPFNAGAWTRLPCGDFLWRLRIRSPGATSISLMFDSLTLGRESQLFVYTDDASVVLGPFSAHNNRADGIFATQPILGDTVTIELRQPEGGPEAFFRLSEIIHGYRNVYELAGSGDNVSNPCSMLVDVNCPPGAAFQDAKHAVGILLMEGYLCSGALLANTKHDALPLFLTANHCYVASSAPSAWVVLFNYEVFGCGGQSAPTTDSVQGAALLTRSPKSDFCLVLLDQIPESYKPYFAGWDRGSAAPTSSTGIHHPSGAPKKISQSYSACVPWSGNTPFAAGAKMWLIPQLDVGATMGGSSGSPLFDQSKRVVGQLYGYLGTNITCIQKNLIYGRLDVSWTEGAKYYLDPEGLAPMTLDGHFSVAPDLSAMALKGPTTGTKGQMIELTLQVEGANVSPSAPVSYRIRISKNKVISSDDPLIAEFPVPKFGMFETPGFTLPTWLPAVTQLRRGQRQRGPLFPGYLYVQPDAIGLPLSAINRMPGVVRVVTFGPEPQPLAHAVVAALAAQVDNVNARGGLPQHPFKPGEIVRFRGGPLEGMEALFVGPTEPAVRVEVLLRFLGSQRMLYVAPDELEVVANPIAARPQSRRSRGAGRPIRKE